nr:unnamed protein product [Callosobruchus chinensis]
MILRSYGLDSDILASNHELRQLYLILLMTRIKIFASRLNRFLRYCLMSAALPWISKLISCFKDKTRVQTVPLLLCASPLTAGWAYHVQQRSDDHVHQNVLYLFHARVDCYLLVVGLVVQGGSRPHKPPPKKSSHKHSASIPASRIFQIPYPMNLKFYLFKFHNIFHDLIGLDNIKALQANLNYKDGFLNSNYSQQPICERIKQTKQWIFVHPKEDVIKAECFDQKQIIKLIAATLKPTETSLRTTWILSPSTSRFCSQDHLTNLKNYSIHDSKRVLKTKVPENRAVRNEVAENLIRCYNDFIDRVVRSFQVLQLNYRIPSSLCEHIDPQIKDELIEIDSTDSETDLDSIEIERDSTNTIMTTGMTATHY